MARSLLPLSFASALLLALGPACGGDDSGPGPTDGSADVDGAASDGGGDVDGGGGMDGGGGGTDGGGGDDDAGPGTDAGADAGPVSMPCTATGECDPFDDTACADGQSCRPGTSGVGTECLDIIDAPEALGESCATSQDCDKGLLCLDFDDGSGFTCQRMCPDGSIGFCGEGQACVGSIGHACIRICRPIPEECDIYAQDCSDPDDTCTFTRNPETGEPYTGCRPAGTQGHGEDCGGDAGDCGHGMVCIRSGDTTSCHFVCRTEGRDPMCTVDGETCSGVARTWDVTYCRVP